MCCSVLMFIQKSGVRLNRASFISAFSFYVIVNLTKRHSFVAYVSSFNCTLRQNA